ncbi:hypothetical protein [Nocardia cyriacigeorgica]|uniref:3'-5' exonuclease n=1 Tax=Nocardia cyriacigeorgica TaxID=135487 RepID=UPI00245561CC|nr:hypothetical protein [Nocardia cyriacigeorgica]
MNAPIVFLDTETDGVHPGRRVWEIAMIRRDETGERETSFFVDIDLSGADPFGLRVGRFYDRHPAGRYLAGLDDDPWAPSNAWHPDIAAREVARWTHGAHIVGAVPNFDTEVLGALLREHGLTPAWHFHLIDIEALMVGWLHATATPGETSGPELPWRSDDLSRAVGVEPPGETERHTAMGDARWAMRVFDRIAGGR